MPVRFTGAKLAACLTAVSMFLSAMTQAAEHDVPRIAIVIDDMGNALRPGRAALALPGEMTYAFLPHTPFAGHLAEQAKQLGKEVMLHLPMESKKALPLGPGGLQLDMSRDAFRDTLDAGLASVPHVVGVNNHMGSLLTSDLAAMRWLMKDLSRRGLYFVDSRTTLASVAEEQARKGAVSVTRRDVFLDSSREPGQIRHQFHRLLQLAGRRGSALAIGHPYPETLQVLAEELPRLEALGVELVPASRLTMIHLRKNLWHVSSSLSPKVAKNLKPSPSSTCCEGPASKWSPPDSATDR